MFFPRRRCCMASVGLCTHIFITTDVGAYTISKGCSPAIPPPIAYGQSTQGCQGVTATLVTNDDLVRLGQIAMRLLLNFHLLWWNIVLRNVRLWCSRHHVMTCSSETRARETIGSRQPHVSPILERCAPAKRNKMRNKMPNFFLSRGDPQMTEIFVSGTEVFSNAKWRRLRTNDVGLTCMLRPNSRAVTHSFLCYHFAVGHAIQILDMSFHFD